MVLRKIGLNSDRMYEPVFMAFCIVRRGRGVSVLSDNDLQLDKIGLQNGRVFALLTGMNCYFGIYNRDGEAGDDKKMLVCFSIPEVGINFKAPFAGEALHTEYASLLTFLEFIELNQKLFQGKELNIYSDNLDLIGQINEKTCQYEYSQLLGKVLEYKEKYTYSIGWIPKGQNPAVRNLFD